jgi:LAO/AO transport system kinase
MDILDAAGFDIVFVETVGVGQLEIDIAHAVHRLLAVFTPETSDEVQAMRSHFIEDNTLFVVNKTDRDKDQFWLRRFTQAVRMMAHEDGKKEFSVFPVSAINREGVDNLSEVLWETFRKHSLKEPKDKTLNGSDRDVYALLEELFLSEVIFRERVKKKVEFYHKDLVSRKKSPYEVAQTILKGCLK